MTLFRKLLLSCVAFGFGVLLGAADFIVQKVRAEGDYDSQDYMLTMIERLDGSGGQLGLMFRRSLLVTAALPPAPAGWEGHLWTSVAYDDLYSREQDKALQRHLVYAVPDLSYLDGLGESEEKLLDAYLDDVSRVYLSDDGGYIDLRVSVDGFSIGSTAWQRYLTEVEAYFDRTGSTHRFARIQGIEWTERVGVVEMAANLDLPFALRTLRGDLGNVHIAISARASDAALRGFLAQVDLSGLRALAQEAPELPVMPEPQPSPDLMAGLSPTAGKSAVAQAE